MSNPRYRFVCVADVPAPAPASPSDDLDAMYAEWEAAGYYGSHFDLYDSLTGRYVPRPDGEDRPDE